MSIHVHPTAELAPRVLLPGDPGRALLLAQSLLASPAMFNHNRGLWGYSGTARDGAALTIQSTGMGGPSAAIVVSELIDLGARVLLRVGTCGALDGGLALGDLIAASDALAADGTSRALGAADRVPATPELHRRLQARPATVVSSDLFYDDREDVERAWVAAGATAIEMEAAALFALAAKRGVQAAALLIVSDIVASRARISADQLRDAEHRAGEVALAALTPDDG